MAGARDCVSVRGWSVAISVISRRHPLPCLVSTACLLRPPAPSRGKRKQTARRKPPQPSDSRLRHLGTALNRPLPPSTALHRPKPPSTALNRPKPPSATIHRPVPPTGSPNGVQQGTSMPPSGAILTSLDTVRPYSPDPACVHPYPAPVHPIRPRSTPDTPLSSPLGAGPARGRPLMTMHQGAGRCVWPGSVAPGAREARCGAAPPAAAPSVTPAAGTAGKRSRHERRRLSRRPVKGCRRRGGPGEAGSRL